MDNFKAVYKILSHLNAPQKNGASFNTCVTVLHPYRRDLSAQFSRHKPILDI